MKYRTYKNFNETNFKNDLRHSLESCNHETMNYEEFRALLFQFGFKNIR